MIGQVRDVLRACSTQPLIPTAPPLSVPEDWVAEIDPSSGSEYYYNKKTQESTWVRP